MAIVPTLRRKRPKSRGTLRGDCRRVGRLGASLEAMRRGFLGRGGAWRPSPGVAAPEDEDEDEDEGVPRKGSKTKPPMVSLEDDADWVAVNRYMGSVQGESSESVDENGRDKVFANWLHMALDKGDRSI